MTRMTCEQMHFKIMLLLFSMSQRTIKRTSSIESELQHKLSVFDEQRNLLYRVFEQQPGPALGLRSEMSNCTDCSKRSCANADFGDIGGDCWTTPRSARAGVARTVAGVAA